MERGTPMTSDGRLSNEELVKRLREEARLNREDFALFAEQYADLVTEAADALATLKRSADEMREALEPFAKLAADIDDDAFGSVLHDGMLLGICSSYEVPISNPTIGDLRRARAAIKALPPQEEGK